jgi:hypothetical protein
MGHSTKGNRSALIVWGGWAGHLPQQTAELFERALTEKGFDVTVSDTLESFLDGDALKRLSLIVPNWTMGQLSDEQLKSVIEAVKSGVGIAGCHGGMCDSFRMAAEWHFMTGGQWVSHPGDDRVEYTVRVTDRNHFITRNAPDRFDVVSEQYYLHTDPANHVLAVTEFPIADGPHVPNGKVDMPVMWTKLYGEGRVFYHSLGHHPDIFTRENVLPLTVRGFLWAAKAEDLE